MSSGFRKRKRKQQKVARLRTKRDKRGVFVSMTRAELAEHYEGTKPEWTPFEPLDAEEVTKRGADEGWINSRFIVYVYNPDNRLSQVQNWKLFETKSNREFIKDTVPTIIGYTQLSIRSIDNDHLAHDWRDLMRIKNELVGPDREAIELYPSMGRIHDTANQYHLWVLPEGMVQPVGWLEPDIIHKHQIEASTDPAIKHANQRTFEEGFLGEFDMESDLNSPKFDLKTIEKRRADLEEE